jgi:hypothetical protein
MPFGMFGLLFIVFLVLKLVGVIAWSWWLVFLPLIAWAVLVIGVITLYTFVGGRPR